MRHLRGRKLSCGRVSPWLAARRIRWRNVSLFAPQKIVITYAIISAGRRASAAGLVAREIRKQVEAALREAEDAARGRASAARSRRCAVHPAVACCPSRCRKSLALTLPRGTSPPTKPAAITMTGRRFRMAASSWLWRMSPDMELDRRYWRRFAALIRAPIFGQHERFLKSMERDQYGDCGGRWGRPVRDVCGCDCGPDRVRKWNSCRRGTHHCSFIG